MIPRHLLLLFLYAYAAVIQASGGILNEDTRPPDLYKYSDFWLSQNSLKGDDLLAEADTLSESLYPLAIPNRKYSQPALITALNNSDAIEQSFNALNRKVALDFDESSFAGSRSKGVDRFTTYHSSSNNLMLASNQADTRALKSTRPVEARHALVIGNSNYDQSPLKNPVNDANTIAHNLHALGFDVTLLFDANREEIINAILKFGQQLKDTQGVGLFYYAGHGMQVNGRNYLIPLDSGIEKESDVDLRAVDANYVLNEMDEASNRINIIILDACRNNPYSRSFRSARAGLAQMDAPRGSFIAYATSPGSVAEDGSGLNSTYSKHLARQMQVKDLPIEKVFKRVRAAVEAETDNRQTPWESTSLNGAFYFAGGESEAIVEQNRPPLYVPPLKQNSNIQLGDIFQLEDPWYKRWYIWAGIIGVAVLAACSGGGEGGTAGSGGSGGGC